MLCNELYERIYQKLERKTDDALRFAPRGTASEILQEDAVRRFYGTIESDSLPTISEQDFVQNIIDRSLQDFLATLIFATCSYAAAVAFATSIVATDDDDGCERKGSLPIDSRHLEGIFKEKADIDRFISKQACFCAVVLQRGQEIKIEGPAMQRLPYIEEKLRGSGDFGKVYSVKIAKGHFNHSLPELGYNSETFELARKDYTKSDEFTKGERKIMKQILHSQSNKCENILESYGSIEVGEMYSLFMPLAISDLKQYMITDNPTRPSTTDAKADIIRCAVGLAEGLNFLHTKIKTPDFDDMVCYHMDLKPSNVLIFRREDGQGNIWKLSDFGMAKVKVRRRGEMGHKEKDFNSWFLRRKQQTEDPSVSGTENRRFEGSYLAPESIENSRLMGTKSDVWSLGCVISIVMTYLDDGKDGILRYEDMRLDHALADGLDRFFVRGRFKHSSPHPSVSRWHKQLVKGAQHRNMNEAKGVQMILHFLDADVFQIAPKERCDAQKIVSTLQKAYISYRDATHNSDSTASSLPGRRDSSWKSLKAWIKHESK